MDVNKFIEEVVCVPLEFSDDVDNRGVIGKLVAIVVLSVGNNVVSETILVDIFKPPLCVEESNEGLDDNAPDVIKRSVNSVLEAEFGSTETVPGVLVDVILSVAFIEDGLYM